MGSRRRQEALTTYDGTGRIIENARAARMRLRSEAAIVREDFALDRFAKGDTVAEIERKLGEEFGVKYQRRVPEMVKRALVRRAAAYAERVEEARALYIEQTMKLVHAWMPRALGEALDGDGRRIPADPKAAELAFKFISAIAEVAGAKAPKKAGDVNITNVVLPADDPDNVREKVLATIEREREKFQVIEGSFTGGIDAATAGDPDSPPPPPINFPLGPAPD